MNRMLPAHGEPAPPRPGFRRTRWFFAGFLVTLGLLDVFETLLGKHPPGDRLLEGMVPTGLVLTGRTATVVAGLALVLLARGIARGKRVAWMVTCLVLAASLVFHLVKNLDVEAAAIALWVLLGLWWMRGAFLVDSDPVAVRRGAATILAAAALYGAYAFIGSWLLRDELAGGFQPLLTLNHLSGSALAGLATAYDPLTDRARWFLGSLPVVAGTLLLAGLLQLLRPVVLRATGLAGADDAELRAALERFGHNPVSWLALGGRTRFWPEPGVAVPYEVARRVAIALGDPIGPPARHAAAVAAFGALCERHDWVGVFYQAERAELYREAGYRLLPIGSDAVVRLDRFDLSGRARADLRHAVRRCEREGVSFAILPGPEALAKHADALREVSADWLRAGKGPEMRFSLGTLESLHDPATVVALALDRRGELIAFASWLPVPARSGWALDLVRRRPGSLNGAVEALIVRSLEEARRRGLAAASLGVAPLSLSGFSPALQGNLFGRLYGRLDRIRAGRSLGRFKAKFGPEWEPRYLAVPGSVVLPEVLAALLAAHLPAPLRLLIGHGRLPGRLPGRRAIA